MLKQRIITALVLVAIVGGVLFYTPPLLFNVCCWLLCLMALYELTKMYQFSLLQTVLLLTATTAIAASSSQLNYDVSQLVRITTVITWCFVVPLVLIFVPKNFSKLAISIFGILLFVPAYYALTVLNALFGPLQLLSILAIAWVADTGAYFVGRSLGCRKLAPRISPGKSIEGAIGGFVLVVIYLALLQHYHLAYYLPKMSMVFKFAFILTTVSIIGDLFESWLKRVANVKDSGNILPGHGGVFDRIDSLIAVLAISFALIRGMI